jgi:hypothetical protein
MILEQLTVHHYDEENESEDKRITLAPHHIIAIAATPDDVQVRGIKLRGATVLMADGNSLPLFINHSDLMLLERAIGSYSLS